MDAKKSGTLETLWVAASESFQIDLVDLVKIFTIPSGKGSLHAVEASPKMPLSKVNDNLSVWFLIKSKSVVEPKNTQSRPTINAFALLMTSRVSRPLDLVQQNNNKDLLYNDIVEITNGNGLKFFTHEMKNAKKLMLCITNCLWSIDLNESKIVTASNDGKCRKLATLFDSIYSKEYHKYKEQKMARPSLCKESLKKSSDELFDIISVWDRTRTSTNLKFWDGCLQLANSLRKYCDYLSVSSQTMFLNRQFSDPPRSADQYFTLPVPYERVAIVKPCYRKLDQSVSVLNEFDPICLDSGMETDIPKDRRKRFEWFKNIGISCGYLLKTLFNKLIV